ncbi:hypothetical protein SAMN05216559_2620 [Halomicrobium zhouii]|uniref:DUF7312 domain-containing protein n=1 Tax=Halomicrobium zhouii TaxID=767519 RepID=A0A1I6LG93_9EURY|nr:hypothetical protein [Halomicrobium zhouii]SFS02268.1 hypothetical protein SAMN05216559_2620 [Halomicrobium zhouii]
MRDDAGRGADDGEESRDGTWGGPASDERVNGDGPDEEQEREYYNQQYEAGVVDGDDDGDGSDDEDVGGNVAGEFRPSATIEPGTPSLENSLFVVFGAYVAVLGLTRLFVDVQGFDAQDLLVLTGGTFLVGLVLFGFFGVLTSDS